MEPQKIIILNKFIHDKSSEIIEMTKDFIEFMSTKFIEVMEYSWITDLPQTSNAKFILFLDGKTLENHDKRNAIQELILQVGKDKVFIVMDEVDEDKASLSHLPIYWLPESVTQRDDLDKLFLHDFIKVVLGIDNAQKEKETIYLATAEEDYLKYRKYIKRELERRGYNILPKEDFLATVKEEDLTAEYEETIFSMMRSSEFSIHFGKQEINERITKYTSQKTLENNIAYQLEKALYKHDSADLNDFKRIIWDFNSKSDTLSDLEYTEKQSKKTEYLHSSVDQLKTFVLRLLEDDLLKKGKVKPKKSNQSKLYIIHKAYMTPLAKKIAQSLSSADFEVVISEISEDFDDNRSFHLKALRDCTMCIVLDDQINDWAWLNSKVHDMLKASGLKRQEPLVHKVLFTEQDPSKIGALIEDNEVDIIRYTEDSVINLVEQYITGVKESV